MFKFLAMFDGILIALMVALNGLLATTIGNDKALIVIHFFGLLGTVILLIGSRTKLKKLGGFPIYLLTAGVLGIFNVLFNNLCFFVLGATTTLSLNLLGQLIASMIIDHLGLLGLKINPINKTKLTGIGIMALGIIAMMKL